MDQGDRWRKLALREVVVSYHHWLALSNDDLLATIKRSHRVPWLTNFNAVLVIHGYECTAILQQHHKLTHVSEDRCSIVAIDMLMMQLPSLHQESNIQAASVLRRT